ncbi:hypothetical protein D1AOALGA4SA_2061 [Olavius algarvensis Delta 1 endosymbiont]|nr:hypothetical protein D1AOALGA4SA_2061 [Olavius algarvensis Delta 1 endosymbiont]
MKKIMGRRSSQIFTDKYGFNLGIQKFGNADIHKDQVEGLPSILSPSLNPSHRGREVDALYLAF